MDGLVEADGQFSELRTHLKRTYRGEEYFFDWHHSGGSVTSLFLGRFHFIKPRLMTKPSVIVPCYFPRDGLGL
jgi:hypothetical protein